MMSHEKLASLHVFKNRERAEEVGGVGLNDPRERHPVSTVPAKP
jgi:hypothetical protein